MDLAEKIKTLVPGAEYVESGDGLWKIPSEKLHDFAKALKYANMLHVKANCVSALPELPYAKAPWERILKDASALKREIPVVIEAHNPSDGPLSGRNKEVCRRIYDFLKDAWPGEIRKVLP